MQTRIRHKTGLLLVLLLLLSLNLSGCRLTYLLHAAAGQAKLLSGAVPMEDGLQDATLSDQKKDRLRLVPHIKAFGERTLGLKETKNYEKIYLASSRPPVYVISACPKDRLAPVTWWFPIVGRMPYLGFFDLETARAEKDKLLAKDLDVSLGAAEAYSTLGWFRDPVTLNMIDDSTLDLVETILHEMTHTTLYVKGQGLFNESVAMLVGKIGALLFLEDFYGPGHPLTLEARDSIEDERLFASYIDALLEKLDSLYRTPIPFQTKLKQREKIFSETLDEFRRLRPKLKTDRFTGFGLVPLNNAYLLTIGLYHRHFHLFEELFLEKGHDLKKTLVFLENLAANEGDMIEKMRLELASKRNT